MKEAREAQQRLEQEREELAQRQRAEEERLRAWREQEEALLAIKAVSESHAVPFWYGGSELLPQGRCGRHLPPGKSAVGAVVFNCSVFPVWGGSLAAVGSTAWRLESCVVALPAGVQVAPPARALPPGGGAAAGAPGGGAAEGG